MRQTKDFAGDRRPPTVRCTPPSKLGGAQPRKRTPFHPTGCVLSSNQHANTLALPPRRGRRLHREVKVECQSARNDQNFVSYLFVDLNLQC